MEHLKRGWIVYAAHVPDFPPPPKIGASIPNLYMVRNGKVRIVEVEVDTKDELKRCVTQLKDSIPHADEVYLAMCNEAQKAKEILKENGLESIEVFSTRTIAKLFRK